MTYSTLCTIVSLCRICLLNVKSSDNKQCFYFIIIISCDMNFFDTYHINIAATLNFIDKNIITLKVKHKIPDSR